MNFPILITSTHWFVPIEQLRLDDGFIYSLSLIIINIIIIIK